MLKTSTALMIGLFFSFSCSYIQNEQKAAALNEQGIVYLNAKDFEQAAKAFEAAEALTQSNELKVTFCRNAAISYSGLEDYENAKKFFLKAAKASKKGSIEYLTNLADVDLISGNVKQALARLKEAEKINASDLAVTNTLGIIYYGSYGVEYQDSEKAISYNLRAFEINQDRTTEELLAQTYYIADKNDKAKGHFLKLKREYPGYVDYDYYLCLIAYEAGEIARQKQSLIN
jgi:tetratricopeptide (TPR) repeat protein